MASLIDFGSLPNGMEATFNKIGKIWLEYRLELEMGTNLG